MVKEAPVLLLLVEYLQQLPHNCLAPDHLRYVADDAGASLCREVLVDGLDTILLEVVPLCMSLALQDLGPLLQLLSRLAHLFLALLTLDDLAQPRQLLEQVGMLAEVPVGRNVIGEVRCLGKRCD